MSRRMTLTALLAGLFSAALMLGAYSSWAEDKPPIKTPGPIKPLPPAKPLEPLKPQDPAKPRPAEKNPNAGDAFVVGSMPDGAIRVLLAKKVNLDFVDVPLQKIVDAIAAQTGLEVMVEAKDSPLPDAGPKQNLTVHLTRISAASALDLVSRDVGWNWFVDQGAVVISNDDRLPVVAQVYNVRDLVLAHPSVGGPDEETLDYDYSSLADLLTGAIPSATWSSDAALLQDCSPFHGTLTISQDWKVQDQVASVLAAFRKARDLKPAQFDAAINAGFEIQSADNQAIDAALATTVKAEPTAAKLDDLAAWIRATYGISVHVDAQARETGLPTAAIVVEAALTPPAATPPGTALVTTPATPAKTPITPTVPIKTAPSVNVVPPATAPLAKPATPAISPILPTISPTISPPSSPEPPVSVAGLPLGEALESLLADSKLAFTVRDEVLLITTKDEEKSLGTVRVYPVGDLIGGSFDKDNIDEEYARLLDVITRNVDPDSWVSLDKPKSGSAYISYLPQGRAMVCTQTRGAHGRVAEMLAKLRKSISEQPAGSATNFPSLAVASQESGRVLITKIYKLNPDLPADDFVTVVKDLVEPKSWGGETDIHGVPVVKELVAARSLGGGAYIHGVPGAIIVRQTGTIHKRVEKLLIDLGAIPDPKKIPPSGTPTLVGRRKTA